MIIEKKFEIFKRMKFLKPVVVIAIIASCFISYKTVAQSVSGKWYGIGHVEIESSTNSYLCELIITQRGSTVTGYFNYFFRDGYFSNKLSGTYNASTRTLRLKPLPILYFRTVNAATGVDAVMTGGFILKVAKTESTLTGSFESDAAHAYTSPAITVKFRKLTKDEPELKERIVRKELEFEEEEPAPVKQQPVQVIETPQQVIAKTAEKKVMMRAKDLTRILDVSEDSVRIDLYDNGEFDQDSISVFYNNKLVQYKQLLKTREPVSFKVHVDSVDTNNDLVMFAENLGSIPPNSAIMIITDKGHRYEIPLTSTYQKNGAVRLRRIQPPAAKN